MIMMCVPLMCVPLLYSQYTRASRLLWLPPQITRGRVRPLLYCVAVADLLLVASDYL